MRRSDLEHIIRAASSLTGEKEFVIIGTSAIHAQRRQLPSHLLTSQDVDMYIKGSEVNSPELAASLGEGSPFHDEFGYYAEDVFPGLAKLPNGWESRLVLLSNDNTGGAVGWLLDTHDLVLSKYAASREKDRPFNREVIRHGLVNKKQLLKLSWEMPVEQDAADSIRQKIAGDFKLAERRIEPPGKQDDKRRLGTTIQIGLEGPKLGPKFEPGR